MVDILVSMRNWSDWEKRIYSDLSLQQATVIKIPNHVMIIGGRPVHKKTDFDFCVGFKGRAIFFDAKSMATEPRFNYKSRLTSDKTIHQLNALLAAKERGNIAGLLFYFQTERLIGWADIKDVYDDIQSGTKTLTATSSFLKTQSDHVPINIKLLTGEP